MTVIVVAAAACPREEERGTSVTERDQIVEHLTEQAWPRWKAEFVAADDDLWIMDLESRYAFSGEEGVRQWREAVRRLRALADLGAHGEYGWFNEATTMALQDATARAYQVLQGAQQRVAAAAVEA
jgi:hypothetical protein